jgi:uncharacterized protein YdiU (UPF0061 family)
MVDTAQALSLIADALGISTETLRVARQLNEAKGASQSENAELIRAFEQIEDVQARCWVTRYAQRGPDLATETQASAAALAFAKLVTRAGRLVAGGSVAGPI